MTAPSALDKLDPSPGIQRPGLGHTDLDALPYQSWHEENQRNRWNGEQAQAQWQATHRDGES